MGELKVVVSQESGVISFNYDELKAYLQKILEEYKGAIFTDDSITHAKSIVADLRSQKKLLDADRIAAKKEWMKPFDSFETKAKELIGLYDQPIDFIDNQIKGYEERQKSEKKAKIIVLYEELIGEIKSFLPLDKIYNPKWENVTYSIKSIREDIETVIESTIQAVIAIEAMKSEAVPEALERFKIDLSLSNAITYINNFEIQKAAILEREKAKQADEIERQKQVEIERIRQEERDKIVAEQKEEQNRMAAIEQAKLETEQRLLGIKIPQNEVFVKPSDIPELDAAFEADDTIKAIFTIYGNVEEIGQVEMYLNSIGLEFRKE